MRLATFFYSIFNGIIIECVYRMWQILHGSGERMTAKNLSFDKIISKYATQSSQKADIFAMTNRLPFCVRWIYSCKCKKTGMDL